MFLVRRQLLNVFFLIFQFYFVFFGQRNERNQHISIRINIKEEYKSAISLTGKERKLVQVGRLERN